MARRFSGQRLRDARTAAGLQPELLALHIGRTAHSVHAYESGRACPSVTVLASLADALSVPTDALFAEVVNVDAA